MPIISTSFNDIGNAGQVPSIVRIETDDSLSTVLTTGYLNVLTHQNLPLSENSLVLVSTGTGANKAVTVMSMTYASGDWSLVVMEGYQGSGSGAVNSVLGTANRITSSGGNNPVIDISASYVGQASITTVGAIGSGTWASTAIPVTNGGTGLTTMTTAYAPVISGTTATGALQVASTGQSNSGYVLTSTGASSLPTWQAAAGGGVTATLPTGVNNIAVFSDADGNIYSGAATAINDGSIQAYGNFVAGKSDGTQPGSVVMYPSGASSGSFTVQPLAASGGNYTTTLSSNPSLAGNKSYLFPNPVTNSELFLAAYDGALSPTTGNLAVYGANLGLLTDGGAPPLTWSNVSGTTQAAAVNKGYIIGNASQTTVTLPATAAVGSVVAIQGKGAGGWILDANTGQTIQVGQSATSSGGTVTSAANFDSIQVVCITADTTWAVSYVLSSGVTTA